MSKRFDNRSVDTFKRDIKFGTQLERYFFREWIGKILDDPCVRITDWDNNGCDNDGGFIAHGDTSGADFKISGTLNYYDMKRPKQMTDWPIELKWVPTAGKLTLKEADLKAYVREEANILFIYNTGKANLRKPKDYNLDRHIKNIENNADYLRYGIMWHWDVKKLYREAKRKDLFQPISYMGNKSGIVIPQNQFKWYFSEKKWTTK